jgi:superfamily I DNA/RNA helicase
MNHNIFRVGTIMQNLGLWFLNDVIWVKTDALPNLNGRRFTNNHETLIWSVKNKDCKKYTFNYEFMKKLNGGKQMKDKIDQYSVVVKQQKFLSIWRAYEKLKEKKKAQDYADLHINTLCLLEANPSIANQWKYCIVDEFQDTNKVQLDLLALLIEKNITIVGDMNQSIYRFRGAYKNNLEFFNKHFKANEKNVYTLAQSHRSPNRVLKAAHVLISNNYANKEDCFEVTSAYNTEGTPIEIYELNNAKKFKPKSK